MKGDVVLACSGLSKTYRDGPIRTEVLREVELEVRAGQTVAIVGASGSGKSTLLHLLGGLDTATAGEVQVLGQPMSRLDDAARGRLRNHALGFIYQFHHLLPEFTALENVAMPLVIGGLPVAKALALACSWSGWAGAAADRRASCPRRTPAGCRAALVTRPAWCLATSPRATWMRNAAAVYELMLELNAEPARPSSLP